MPSPQGALLLTTRRNDRVRLERFISDVYTRDVLPFPGMVLGKGDLLRPGAIMRGFSLRGGFGRRATSLTTPHRPVVAEPGSLNEPNGLEHEIEDQKKGDKHEASDVECEHRETVRIEEPPGSLGRSKTVRLKQITKQISRTDLWSLGEGSKEQREEGSETNGMKGPVFQGLLSALGVRKGRRTRSIAVG